MAVALADSVGMALSASSSFHGPLPSSFKCSGLRICLPACRSSRSSTAAGVRNRNASRNAGVVVCEQQQGTMAPVGEVTDKTWKTLVLESNLPVVVDFWAPWCGPCRMIAPLIDDLAKQYAGKIICLKLNTDESPNTATEYGIRSIPTVMVFVRGEKKDTIIGAVPKSTLTSTIEKFVVR